VRVTIVEQAGTRARYFVYAPDGHELRQSERDVSRELARAQKQHKSLKQVLEEEESD